MGRRSGHLSARYESGYEGARAALSGGPVSQVCEFPDTDDAPPRRSSLPFGFVVGHSEEIEPLLYERDAR